MKKQTEEEKDINSVCETLKTIHQVDFLRDGMDVDIKVNLARLQIDIRCADDSLDTLVLSLRRGDDNIRVAITNKKLQEDQFICFCSNQKFLLDFLTFRYAMPEEDE